MGFLDNIAKWLDNGTPSAWSEIKQEVPANSALGIIEGKNDAPNEADWDNWAAAQVAAKNAWLINNPTDLKYYAITWQLSDLPPTNNAIFPSVIPNILKIGKVISFLDTLTSGPVMKEEDWHWYSYVIHPGDATLQLISDLLSILPGITKDNALYFYKYFLMTSGIITGVIIGGLFGMEFISIFGELPVVGRFVRWLISIGFSIPTTLAAYTFIRTVEVMLHKKILPRDSDFQASMFAEYLPDTSPTPALTLGPLDNVTFEQFAADHDITGNPLTDNDWTPPDDSAPELNADDATEQLMLQNPQLMLDENALSDNY